MPADTGNAALNDRVDEAYRRLDEQLQTLKRIEAKHFDALRAIRDRLATGEAAAVIALIDDMLDEAERQWTN